MVFLKKNIRPVLAFVLLMQSFSLLAQSDGKAAFQDQPQSNSPARNKPLENLNDNKEISPGFKIKNGVEYKIIKQGNSTKDIHIGDIVDLYFYIIVDDKIISDSRKLNNNKPLRLEAAEPRFNGDFTGDVTLLKVGDSAIFRVSAETLIQSNIQLPTYLKRGQSIEYRLFVVSVKSKEEIKNETNKKMTAQSVIDDKKLNDYFIINNIKANKTSSGLYYRIEKTGQGNNPKTGQKVTVNYTGYLLNGEKFDSNADTDFHHFEPFTFPLGQGQVIRGWDEGIALLKRGSKATLYIPSALAYGQQARSEKIQANSILIFQVELVDIN